MAGGTNGSGMTDPDRIWSEASLRLRAEIGDGPFSSYIAPSAVRMDGAGHLILVTPTAYARDWVRKNALRRMNEIGWPGRPEPPSGRALPRRGRFGSAGVRHDGGRCRGRRPAPGGPLLRRT